jgi:hypothetical protein
MLKNEFSRRIYCLNCYKNHSDFQVKKHLNIFTNFRQHLPNNIR